MSNNIWNVESGVARVQTSVNQFSERLKKVESLPARLVQLEKNVEYMIEQNKKIIEHFSSSYPKI